jgi:hypothetical protein
MYKNNVRVISDFPALLVDQDHRTAGAPLQIMIILGLGGTIRPLYMISYNYTVYIQLEHCKKQRYVNGMNIAVHFQSYGVP